MKEILISALGYLIILTLLHTVIVGEYPPLFVFVCFAVLSYANSCYVYDEMDKKNMFDK